MANRSVVALHSIVSSEPGAPMEFAGKYDDKGEPILQKQTFTIRPGTVFEMDEADPDFLPFIEQESIRLATDAEIQQGRAIEW